MKIIANGLIMAAEIAAVAAVAWFAWQFPFLFAAASAALAFALGLGLEVARLRNELPFYFGNDARGRGLLVPVIGVLEALFKGVIAGFAAILTFAGTDHDRLFWVALAFGVTVYAGAAMLRMLSINFDARPLRWGFFRLAPALGLLFSLGLGALVSGGFIPALSANDIGWKMVFDLPARPSLEQVSELFFQLKQAFDGFVVAILSTLMPSAWASAMGIVVSVNVLAGFVAALYAAAIASVVRGAESRIL